MPIKYQYHKKRKIRQNYFAWMPPFIVHTNVDKQRRLARCAVIVQPNQPLFEVAECVSIHREPEYQSPAYDSLEQHLHLHRDSHLLRNTVLRSALRAAPDRLIHIHNGRLVAERGGSFDGILLSIDSHVRSLFTFVANRTAAHHRRSGYSIPPRRIGNWGALPSHSAHIQSLFRRHRYFQAHRLAGYVHRNGQLINSVHFLRLLFPVRCHLYHLHQLGVLLRWDCRRQVWIA